jgi:hypothetical protein
MSSWPERRGGANMEEGIERSGRWERVSSALNSAETFYLRVLRGAILVVATGLLLYAAGLALISLYKVTRSPQSVQEKEAAVAPGELTRAGIPARAGAETSADPEVNPAQRQAYDRFLRAYYNLFRTRFEPFRQSTDRQLSVSDFDGTFVNTGTRLTAVSRGELDFAADQRDLRSLYGAIKDAAALPETQNRLRAYQRAQRVRVCRNAQRMRTIDRPGWDPYGTSCANWYENMGCPVTRRVQTPVTERVCQMQLPQGTQSHLDIFRAYQNEFYRLLNQRREANAAEAAAARSSIEQGILEGRLDLATVLRMLGAFLALMFFFLLVAIERHQRNRMRAARSAAAPALD